MCIHLFYRKFSHLCSATILWMGKYRNLSRILLPRCVSASGPQPGISNGRRGGGLHMTKASGLGAHLASQLVQGLPWYGIQVEILLSVAQLPLTPKRPGVHINLTQNFFFLLIEFPFVMIKVLQSVHIKYSQMRCQNGWYLCKSISLTLSNKNNTRFMFKNIFNGYIQMYRYFIRKFFANTWILIVEFLLQSYISGYAQIYNYIYRI